MNLLLKYKGTKTPKQTMEHWYILLKEVDLSVTSFCLLYLSVHAFLFHTGYPCIFTGKDKKSGK